MSFLDFFRRKKKVVEVAWMSGTPSPADIAALRLGTQKTVVIKLCCGSCKKEWHDAVRPNKAEQVPCPACSAFNEVTYNLSIVVVG